MAPTLSEMASEYQAENSDDDYLKQSAQFHPAMGTPIQKPEAKEIGRRLRDFRLGLADFLETPNLKTLRTFAEKTDVPENNLTAWELGRAIVPPWFIKRLAEKYGVSFLFDWIYMGNLSGLSGRLAEAIQSHRRPKAVEEPRTEKTRRYKRGAA